MEKQEHTRSAGRPRSLHDSTAQEETTLQWIGYLYLEIAQLNDSISDALTMQEIEELEERRKVVIEEYKTQLKGITAKKQRLCYEGHLPF